MTNAQFEIILIACITAVACSIPGTLLVLRRMTMLGDAISHSVLLGIIVGFFFIQTVDSPVLVICAGATGMLTVVLVEWLHKTGLVKEDAAIGVIYPFMFSVAVILISLFASQVHIDTDAVLTGELAFAPLNRLVIWGNDWGPLSVYQIGGVLIINIILCIMFYKEIKLSIFDYNYATTAGFKPKAVMYGLMLVVSVTAVVSFEVVGSIMVVGLIVGPALIASYFTKRLWAMLFLAPIIGVIASLMGYSTAHTFNISIAGSIVTIIGILFMLVFIFTPKTGLIAKAYHRRMLRNDFAVNMLLVHLWQHEILGDSNEENNKNTISTHFNWDEQYTNTITDMSIDKGFMIVDQSDMMRLSAAGRIHARKVMEN